ncbi:MAG: hypothetical protein KME17_19360 [Cyanosarcina radialis HA8281-LM2]|jgi:hypothetical protein|nr:hypothetical protein [Cyanosarcina radialis HA8281-LM2]
MLTEILPFELHLDPTAIAGAALWSLAFYLGCSGLTDWITDKLTRWFNFAERSLYTSQTEFEKTRKGRESQNAFFASLFSIVPFLLVGSLCNWGVDLSLGRSWSISIGLLACMSCGIYELGRRQG